MGSAPWARGGPVDEGRARVPWPVALALVPVLALWTLPQTLVGLLVVAWFRLAGWRARAYAFGPFRFMVLPRRLGSARGISLGLVVLAEDPRILQHEFCHLFTGLWLGWLYLPVYGLEYLLMGHERSWHERVTCWLTDRVPWGWCRLDDRPAQRGETRRR